MMDYKKGFSLIACAGMLFYATIMLSLVFQW